MKVQSYKDLLVWQKAMDWVDQVYQVTRAFPKEELYGLTSQLRKAAVSVPSNIAEGQGRTSTKDFLRHLSISYGSLMEAETQTEIARRQNYLSNEKSQMLFQQSAEIGRMLNGLSQKLLQRLDSGQ